MTINIELENYNTALNQFNKEILSDDLNNYILTNCYKPFLNKNITLNIKGLTKKEEQEKLTNLIHNHYEQLYQIHKKITNFDDYFRICLFLIGIIAILISEQFVSFLEDIFEIAGWVVIWEAIYDVIFKEIDRQKKKRIYTFLSSCNITYE